MRLTGDPRSSHRPRGHLGSDLVAGLAVFGFYLVVAGLDGPGRIAEARRNGLDLLRFERWAHIDIEASANRWLSGHGVLETLANYEYATTYLISAFGLLFWLYFTHPGEYRRARDSFIALNVIAIACFAVFPTMPPRLLGGQGYVDTVERGDVWFSWGSAATAHANTLAAMPSLHVAWAMWVSAVLAMLGRRWWVQGISAAHVLLTVAVIVATANHYLVDAFGGAVLVLASLVVGRRWEQWRDRRQVRIGRLVPSADAFFLHVEDGAEPAAPQQVGGVVILDVSVLPGGRLSRDRLEEVLRAAAPQMPRFRQRLSRPGGVADARGSLGGRLARWRRWRWVPAEDLDWDWHVQERDLHGADGGPGGLEALHALVGELARTPLPRDRPLWRAFTVHGVGPSQGAMLLVVHHVVSDGIGTVAQALSFLEPVPGGQEWAGLESARARPGRLKRLGAIVVGVAQLATDGRPKGRMPESADGARGFLTIGVDLEQVRATAKLHRVRVSDVLLAGAAAGLAHSAPQLAAGPRPTVKVAVPLMVQAPDDTAEGNLTAAVMLDLPLEPEQAQHDNPGVDQLRLIARRSRGLYSGTRALASRWVMQLVGSVLPPPGHAWFARFFYGRRIFQAIVSNMPGPDVPLTLGGAPLQLVFPLLPLAPGAPLALGSLGWNGQMCLGVSYDPALIGDPGSFAAAVRARIEQLGSEHLESGQVGSAQLGSGRDDADGPHSSTNVSLAR